VVRKIYFSSASALRLKLPYTRCSCSSIVKDLGRQQAAQPERVAFGFGESSPLVKQGVGEKGGAAGEHRASMRTQAAIGGLGVVHMIGKIDGPMEPNEDD